MKKTKKTSSKKRNKTTKIVTILLFLISIGVLAFTTINSSTKESKVKYTPNFYFTENYPINMGSVLSANGIDKIEDTELNEILENAKTRILSCKKEINRKIENLNWDVLDEVKIYYSTKFIDELGEENDVKAHYNSETKSVEVNLRAKGMEDLEETVIHELFHGILGKHIISDDAGCAIVEAIVEELSKIVIGDSYIMYYYDEAQMLYMMYNIWGEKETINYIMDEEIFSKIDELTKKGYGKKAMQALDLYKEFKNTNVEIAYIGYAIAQEVIVNATGKMAEEIEVEEGKKMIRRCRKLMADIEGKYYTDILGL